MASRIKYAAVGCGGMGRRHLRGIATLVQRRREQLELVAVCDLNHENANLLADEAEQLLGTRPRVFTDIAEMVREIADLEAAGVTTRAAPPQGGDRPAWRPACTSCARSRWPSRCAAAT